MTQHYHAGLIRINVGGHTVTIGGGRCAQVARALLAAGQRGVTTLDFPLGWRVSAFIHKLRGTGLDIRTSREPHTGADGVTGYHGRFTLHGATEVA